jgi:hypothetical protein
MSAGSIKCTITDQHGNDVPSDLIFLDCQWLNYMSDEEARKICELDWYMPWDRILDKPILFIFVSAEAVNKCVGDFVDFNSDQLVFTSVDWLKIGQVLHRWNREDGWYHA